jgi:hypothetical protein
MDYQLGRSLGRGALSHVRELWSAVVSALNPASWRLREQPNCLTRELITMSAQPDASSRFAEMSLGAVVGSLGDDCEGLVKYCVALDCC